MKRIVAVLLLLVLAVTLFACADDSTAPDGMMNIAGENDKFYFYVPESWVTQGHAASAASAPNADGSNVRVTTYLPEKVYTPESYWEEICLPQMELGFVELEVIEDRCEQTTLGGADAAKYVYTASLGATTYWYMEVISVYDNLVYRLTYTSVSEYFDLHIEDIELMCESFEYR